MQLRIDHLPPADSAQADHMMPAMLDGTTELLSVGQVATLITALLTDSAPTTLDTLNEIAAALGDDPSFAATVTSLLALKADTAAVNSDLALRLRFDAGQILSASEAGRARANMGAGVLAGQRNKLINGHLDRDLWQRGVSIVIAAGNSAYVADRWRIANDTNQSVTVSRQDHAIGALFDTRHKMRLAFGSAPTSGNLTIEQRIEDVATLENKTASARAYFTGPPGAETLACEIVQNFGSGGAPSGPVTTAAAALDIATVHDAATQERRAQFVVPPVAGKSLGTNGNDYLALRWILSPRQAGNYEVARLSFVEGDAWHEADPSARRSASWELLASQRYYETGSARLTCNGTAGSSIEYSHGFKTIKRVVPSITLSDIVYINASGASSNGISADSFYFNATATTTALARVGATFRADAEI